MQIDEKQTHPIYSRNVIDFLTVAAEYCSFLESCDKESDKNFIDKITKILPLLYLKVSLLPKFELMSDEMIRQFVSEDDYEYIKELITKKTAQ